MSKFPAATKKAILVALTLTTVLTLLITAACTSEEAQPDQTEQALLENTEKLGSDIATLRQELEELRSTKSQETAQSIKLLESTPARPARTPRATTIGPTATSEPTPAAIAITVTIPTPSGPGICGRSPKLQEAILYTLNVSYCQLVNEAEMVRISGDWAVGLDEVRPGDFRGLINITSISVHTRDIRAGAFVGLENLKTMKLNVHRYGSIAPGAWQGLDKLEELSIESKHRSESEEGPILTLQDFQNLPSLNNLRINGWLYLQADTISETLFSNLSNLEVLSLEKLKAEGKEEDIHLPGRLFLKNTKLRQVSIGIDYATEHQGAPVRGHVRQQPRTGASFVPRRKLQDAQDDVRTPRKTGEESPYHMENRITDQNSSCRRTRPYTGGSSWATTIPAGTK